MKLSGKKMKMPEKKSQEEMDLSELEQGSPADMSSDAMSAEEAAPDSEALPGEEEAMVDSGKLEAVSDDELMAEIEKRGLMSQLGEQPGKRPMSPDDSEEEDGGSARYI